VSDALQDVSKAKKEYHVSVTQKKSTQEAMEYVKGKADKFKKAASSQFRVVTDFHVRVSATY
jgi:hypothetical protein